MSDFEYMYKIKIDHDLLFRWADENHVILPCDPEERCPQDAARLVYLLFPSWSRKDEDFDVITSDDEKTIFAEGSARKISDLMNTMRHLSYRYVDGEPDPIEF